MNNKGGIGKKGQITIFIIIAILIVASVLVFFFWIKPTFITPATGKLGLEECMKEAVEDKISKLGEQAGFINPGFYYTYKDKEIGYLCYTNQYYTPCVMQKPFLKQHFESQLKESVQNEIYDCYDDSLAELEKRGYTVTGSEKNLNISIELNQIIVELDAPVSITRESSSRFTKFTSRLNSPLSTRMALNGLE